MEKKVINGIIISNREIAPGVFKMEVEAPEAADSAKPGQFLNIYPKSRHTLLPRPISICMSDGVALTLVYSVVGSGTLEFSGYVAGDTVRISSPLGNGYDLDGIIRDIDNWEKNDDGGSSRPAAILVGGGIGVPPLVGLAGELIAKGIDCIAVLGFRDEPFLENVIREMGVATFIATDSGKSGFKGTVLQLIRDRGISGGHFFACGPKIMLHALNDYCTEIEAPLQVSMEERMGCGYGACVGCVCRIREQSGSDGTEHRTAYKKVCTDGPVFYGKDVAWDE